MSLIWGPEVVLQAVKLWQRFPPRDASRYANVSETARHLVRSFGAAKRERAVANENGSSVGYACAHVKLLTSRAFSNLHNSA